ncbi:hypothetical protein HMPREF1981_02709 [Bacteroides pyogenes F0041]|uniref:Uncharacterized protein n=1 Tax=Bacteroides pyogenes F0041 TaxID=1321819 RepID=U2BV01_9BACE|nr:hypothetical protein HMPREF1981_02709 [Bacteroides pyogenes F0041]
MCFLFFKKKCDKSRCKYTAFASNSKFFAATSFFLSASLCFLSYTVCRF